MATTTPPNTPGRAKMQDDTPNATLEERVNAIETMLGHLIFVLETEPDFTAESLLLWIQACRERERAHGIADARAQVVFSQLCEKLQLLEDDQPEADEAAKQAARAALNPFRSQPPAD